MATPSVYQDTIQYLYTRLPMFSRLGKKALKANLTNITTLCAELGNPHQQFKSIHLAGTNGKGSTSHGLSAILQEAGYKVGLYTSPHLIDFRERIRINGQPVSQEWVINFVEKHKALIESVQPSFFEITVAMAFAYFSEQNVDIAVIETGLGGRLDSTNIILPILSIITNISYDHQDLLGNTLSEIAKEKAGIIKPGIPVLLGEQQEETDSVFFEESIHKQSILHYAETLWDLVKVKQDTDFQYFKAIKAGSRELFEFKTDLLGKYQSHNLCTILAACDILALYGFPTYLEQRWAALERVKSISGLRGRWDVW
ncbi:MAG: bifunctional folylpolyglutamate synthase/dihydrofolate synthase, partial [Bacteroidetes bacterium]|nr:bifunctional folylpolyglutamate synthase/dihydrofolate synthase [Bacteroidota bacterium]